MNKVFLSFVISAYATFGLGFLSFPAAVGTSLLLLLLMGSLFSCLTQQQKGVSHVDRVELLLATFLACSLSYRTNVLCNVTSALVVMLYMVMLAVRRSCPRYEPTVDTIVIAAGLWIRAFLMRWYAATRSSASLSYLRLSRQSVLAILLSLPALVVFHMLFAEINGDYASWVRSVLQILFSWKVLLYSSELLLQGTFVYALLTTCFDCEGAVTNGWSKWPMLTSALFIVSLLFLLFAGFQTMAVVAVASETAFQQISLYVQRGFWELITVGIFGLSLWLLVHLRGADASRLLTLRKTTAGFALLLAVACLFTLHKVYLLQSEFGFKDHRLYGTFLTLLLLLSALLAVLVSRGAISSNRMLRILQFSSIAGAASLAMTNVDLVATRYNPIRYVIGEDKFKDYSYLLANSFDNVSDWSGLIDEVVRDGIHNPENYYWGYYKPLCWRPSSGASEVIPLRNQIEELVTRYGTPTQSVRDYLQFNVGEFNAYRWVLSHNDLLNRLYQVAMRDCSDGAHSYTSSLMNYSIKRGGF